MDKVPTPLQIPLKMQERTAQLEQHVQTLNAQIAEKRRTVEQLELDITSLRSSEYSKEIAKEKDGVASTDRKALDALQRERVATSETIKALQFMQRRDAAGEGSSPTAHIRTIHHPEPPPPFNSRIVDVWAAVSGALALLALVLLIALRPPFWPSLIAGVLLVFAAIEAATRGRLTNFLLTTVIILAIIAGVILVIEFWQLILVLAVFGVVIFMMVDNLRELARG